MAQNPGPDPQIPLNTFAGLVTNMDPVALPAGASPDNQDCAFLPGGVSSRPALSRVFPSPLGRVTFTSASSYVDPKGDIRNVFLDSAGNLWVEDLSNPKHATVLATVTPGSYAKFTTAFGRLYIAISDKLHGSDIPLQLSYDSTGTAQLDRVTQDGPGASPTFVSVALPPVTLAASGAPATLTVREIDPAGPSGGPPPFYTQVNIYTTTTTGSVQPGDMVTVSGTGSIFDGTYAPVLAVYAPNLIVAAAYFPPGTAFYVGGGTITISSGTTLSRAGNIVSGTTATAHGLQPGYQVQVAGIPAAAVGGHISSIAINNEAFPGQALVTTSAAHGLVPGLSVSITGIPGTAVGGAASVARAGQIVTVTTTTAHGLAPGAVVTLAGFATASFNTTSTILTVPDPKSFTFIQADTDATDTGGTVTLAWPVPATATPSYFQVLTAPSATTFTVQVHYPDGTWTGVSTSLVSYAWDGIFFVQSVPSTTTFTYQQYGPDATTSTAGTITPFGQAAPGKRQGQVFFITRNGLTTAPSPPQTFVTNGGEFIAVSNIPIGPPNVIARAIAFTGAEGAYFFYIPSPPQVNGQLVGTATQINDNTTTSAVFDFGDPTLLSALGINIQGNNLPKQIVIDGALGFGFYGSRLWTYGQRNIVQGGEANGSLLNLGFDGGFLPSAPTTPTGWTSDPSNTVAQTTLSAAVTDTTGTTFHLASGAGIANGAILYVDAEAVLVVSGGGTTTPTVTRGVNGTVPSTHASGRTVFLAPSYLTTSGRFGSGWQIGVVAGAGACGKISQSFYQDYTGAPLATPHTPYRLRVWLKPSVAADDLTFTVKMSSASTGFSSTATIAGGAMSLTGRFLEADFTLSVPAPVPSDFTLSVYASSTATSLNLIVDEITIIYADSPYLKGCYASYVNNPEAFDGVSGVVVPVQDTHQVMGLGIIRDNLCMLTQDPAGRLHQTSQGLTEPADWTVDETSANCGMISAFSLTVSQTDDQTGSGGEERMSWYSANGVQIYSGGEVEKISQEIQRPQGQEFPGAPPDLGALNPAAVLSVWGLDDPKSKTMWFGIPEDSATAPTVMWMLSYIGLDSAAAIAEAQPIHRALSGRLIASDGGRKWSPWRRPINGAALMYRESGEIVPVFLGGNGSEP